jgi:hypothetical protein
LPACIVHGHGAHQHLLRDLLKPHVDLYDLLYHGQVAHARQYREIVRVAAKRFLDAAAAADSTFSATPLQRMGTRYAHVAADGSAANQTQEPQQERQQHPASLPSASSVSSTSPSSSSSSSPSSAAATVLSHQPLLLDTLGPLCTLKQIKNMMKASDKAAPGTAARK